MGSCWVCCWSSRNRRRRPPRSLRFPSSSTIRPPRRRPRPRKPGPLAGTRPCLSHRRRHGARISVPPRTGRRPTLRRHRGAMSFRLQGPLGKVRQNPLPPLHSRNRHRPGHSRRNLPRSNRGRGKHRRHRSGSAPWIVPRRQAARLCPPRPRLGSPRSGERTGKRRWIVPRLRSRRPPRRTPRPGSSRQRRLPGPRLPRLRLLLRPSPRPPGAMRWSAGCRPTRLIPTPRAEMLCRGGSWSASSSTAGGTSRR